MEYLLTDSPEEPKKLPICAICVICGSNVGPLRPWFFRELCTMPDRNDPYDIALNSVKEPIWRYNYLPIGKVWKLRYDSSGFGKVLEPLQDSFGSITKTDCR